MWLHISLISLYGVFIFVTKAAEIQSLRQIISAELGASVSLQCSVPVKVSLLYWYKQSIGNKPQLLVTVPKYGFVEFYGEFKDNPRFTVARNSGIANLSILNTIPSDTAVYHCAQFNAGIMSFGEGTLLILPDAEYSHHTILQKPMSYQGQQGDSVNFQCTIHTSVSNGKHSVYWFRHGSGESHPGIIYTQGNRSDECEKSSETDCSTQSCVYKLPKRNLSLSDAGTYYCAVAACGQILFGNGSNLKVEGMVQLQDASNGTIQSVKLGDNVTIKCHMPQKSVTTMVWYKQSIGQSPRPVAFSYNYLSDTKFEDEFQNGTETNLNNIKQPMLELVHPGDSVTLQCTVLTESCSGEHSVYWFRHGSGESHPGIIYTHGNRNGQCKKMTKTGSSTQSCVYKLPKRNLSLSDAGTYYCAVLMCGEILFGNRTALKIMGNFEFFIIMLT
ncbi:uncharacterized protein LOC118826122 [Colossoma macropomum]|uniref:uncharacterized protein LOC118826122 n=1 Tax=Colossoma macropomum TaxID=42526 RepID=UPI001864CE0F|nr:uncharacterized protein LOC118826122 [Colossoma macropomum]